MIFCLQAVHHILHICMKILIESTRFLPKETKFAQFLSDRRQTNWNAAFAKASQDLHMRQQNQPVQIYWFHIASAGELEQAIPVARSLAEAPTNPQATVHFIVSYTSPSAKPFLKNFPNTIFTCALPLFDRKKIRAVFEVFSPAALFFVRYDLWPLLILEARRHKVRLFLIAASSRLVRSGIMGTIGKQFRRLILPHFDHIFVVNQSDIHPFATLLGEQKVTLAGEPKWARAKERAEDLRAKKPLLGAIQRWIAPQRALSNAKVLVFGSPHSEEWEVVRMLLCDKETNCLLIIAPHEVDDASIKKRLEFLNSLHCHVVKLSDLLLASLESASTSNILEDDTHHLNTRFKRKHLLEMTEAARTRLQWHQASSGKMISKISKSVLLVDSMGVLAEIYSAGDLAIVGGGFDGNLHNCLEPAAQGLPVLFGARHHRAPEALELLEAEAAMKFETKEEMFQFLKHCYNVQEKGCATSSSGNPLPRMALNSARLFECVPKTNQIIRMHLTQYNETQT